MKILAKKAWTRSSTERLLIIPVTAVDIEKRGRNKSSAKISSTLSDLELASRGKLKQSLRNAKFQAKPGESFTLTTFEAGLPQTMVFVGWETKTGADYEQNFSYRRFGSLVAELAQRSNCARLTVATDHLNIKDETFLTAMIEGLILTGYSFTQYKSKKNGNQFRLESVSIAGAKSISQQVINRAAAACEATLLARSLINIPPQNCTPTFLAQQCRKIAKSQRLKINVFDSRALKKMKAGAILAVAQGSNEPAYLVRMVYKPKKKSKKSVSLIGKGVTFDSGGLSIKTGAGMETMKSDMSGAAAVMSIMSVISSVKPNFEVRAYIPTTENMINGQAMRPGDVITAMSGKTIEVLNTDAEGRLILADAITLAERDGSDVIIDLATLTGACMVALGTDYAGLFSNDDKLANKLVAAGDKAGELFWRMPLAREYRDWIKSPVADIKNVGKPLAGHITAALFLEEFIVKARWAHLDIAGTAFSDADRGHIRRGGVGFGVRTILNYLSEN